MHKYTNTKHNNVNANRNNKYTTNSKQLSITLSIDTSE